MTLWGGQFGADLLHDFHPGIPASGLFWTVVVPPTAVTHDLDSAAASLRLRDLAMPDFIGQTSGLSDLSVPATVSMEIVWSGNGVTLSVSDPLNEFDGSYRECAATVQWSAAEDGFRFTSDPDGTSDTRFAQIGRERTGVFAGRS